MQYISDIHLEHYITSKLNYPRIQSTAPYLALCGDIGYPLQNNYKEFLTYCSNLYKHIFLIAGNHEYYQLKYPPLNMIEIEGVIKSNVYNLPNIHYLQNRAVILDTENNTVREFDKGRYQRKDNNYIIMGTTLWSHIPFEKENIVTKYVNDYKNIYNLDINVNPSDINNLHKKACNWLKDNLFGLTKDDKTIILTHHLPTHKLVSSKYKDNELNCCYATEVNIYNPSIKAWIAGHNHSSIKLQDGNTVYAINCMGYIKENVEGFDQGKVIEI